MLKHYQNAGLIPLLEKIRQPGRYQGMNGVNVLTNAAPDDQYRADEVVRELRRAVEAGKQKEASFAPVFTHPLQGLAHGLNPYTDWSLSKLNRPPSHYYLFLGLDWYSISALGNTETWSSYLANPLSDIRDLYFQRLWAWMLRRTSPAANGAGWATPVPESEAAEFIRKDGGAFIFHNRIPYLRPADSASSGSKWPQQEWKKVGADAIEDLRILRGIAKGRIIAYCTGVDSVEALRRAGYSEKGIINWKAHPSLVFYPKDFEGDPDRRFKPWSEFSSKG